MINKLLIKRVRHTGDYRDEFKQRNTNRQSHPSILSGDPDGFSK